MARRHQQLEDSLKLHKFVHDIEDEMAWIREREPVASSTALGNSLTNVQNQLKRHQVRMQCRQQTRNMVDSKWPVISIHC